MAYTTVLQETLDDINRRLELLELAQLQAISLVDTITLGVSGNSTAIYRKEG